MNEPRRGILFSNDCSTYPFKKYRKVAYINSSGMCNLNCEYCFTNNNKAHASITKADFDFLIESYGESFLLCFSGQGDFFSGYKKSDRFLEHVLSHDVRVYLDINASLVHELFEIREQDLAKIVHYDISFHYETMKEKNILDQWADNVRALGSRVAPEQWHVKGIISMRQLERLHEKIRFYADKIYPGTQKKLTLALDDFDNSIYQKPVIKLINSIIEKYPDAVVQQQFASRESREDTTSQRYLQATQQQTMCPAGALYFKIGIDGEVSPCNKLKKDLGITLGNLKTRKLGFLCQLIPCSPLRGPGCIMNWDTKYPAA